MFGIQVLEVAIGLVFAYLMFSSVCSGLFELFSNITKLRSRHMEDGLKKMLDDPKGTVIVNELYKHHLISSGFEDKLGKVTNIANHKFSQALLDILAPGNKGQGSRQIQELQAKLNDPDSKIPAELKKKLNNILEKSNDKVGAFRKGVEDWFDHSMDHVSKWYKKRAAGIIIFWAFVVVIGFNADTIQMAKAFWNDDELRSGISMAAANYLETTDKNPVKYTVYNVRNGGQKIVPVEAPPPDSNAEVIDTVTLNVYGDLKATLDTLDAAINQASVLPVGWASEKIPAPNTKPFWTWLLYKFIGLMFTIGAVSLGAPYWFDILKKLASVRTAIKGGTNTDSRQKDVEQEERKDQEAEEEDQAKSK